MLIVLGGLGTFVGPFVGAVIWIVFLQLAIDIPFVQAFPETRFALLGIILIALMLFRPQGLAASARVQLIMAGLAAPEAGMSPLLATKGLTVRFGGLEAIGGLDLAVQRGTIHGLIGPNGAGKTTVLNVLTGFIRPTAGMLSFDGHEIGGLSVNAIAAFRARPHLPEHPAVRRHDRAGERAGRRPSPLPRLPARADLRLGQGPRHRSAR